MLTDPSSAPPTLPYPPFPFGPDGPPFETIWQVYEVPYVKVPPHIPLFIDIIRQEYPFIEYPIDTKPDLRILDSLFPSTHLDPFLETGTSSNSISISHDISYSQKPSHRPFTDDRAETESEHVMTAPLASAELTDTSPRGKMMRRVLSQGSNASSSTGTHLKSPPSASSPLSPASGGTRTPRARKAALKAEGEDVQVTRKDGETLASDLNGLKVQSPMLGDVSLPTGDAKNHTPIATTSSIMPIQPPTMPYIQSHMLPVPYQPQQMAGPHHERGNSSSTDSSNSYPGPPSGLGSSYGPEGFPRTTTPFEEGVTDYGLSAEAAAAVAAADEAIKQLNGTASVIQGPGMGSQSAFDRSLQVTNGTNFMQAQNRVSRPHIDHSASRQSSTSSSTTEASTSSEESDLCVPTIEWVKLPTPVGPPGPMSGHTPFQFTPYLPSAVPQQRGGPPRMPPPASTTRGGGPFSSPRRNGVPHASLNTPPLDHRQSLPLGATASTPSGIARASALPLDVDMNAAAEEDDDTATVGQGREQSPSSNSSQSARSGFDLLWRAASVSKSSQSDRDVDRDHEPPNDSYGTPYDSKGKRKAGAEAVAQWRTSGIPTGRTVRHANNGNSSHDHSSAVQVKPEHNGNGTHPSGTLAVQPSPPRKRRRSELALESIDPALRDDSQFGDESAKNDGNASEYSESAVVDGSGDDSEYGAGPFKGSGRARGAVRGAKKAGGGRKVHTVGNGSTAKSSSGAAAVARKKKGEEANTGTGAGTAARRDSGAAASATGAHGVQCEYINPLPPYNRCQDFFTRKYDLPRHMARHARREGELVFEGKLAEAKATLWKTIKDKPKVTCAKCGESFTRMDALKRHQAKQHH